MEQPPYGWLPAHAANVIHVATPYRMWRGFTSLPLHGAELKF